MRGEADAGSIVGEVRVERRGGGDRAERGDAGGASYGAYQFATNAGVPAAFVAWLGEQGYAGAAALAAAGEPGTEGFDAAWHEAAEADGAGFLAMQHRFVREMYYEPVRATLLGLGVDVAGRPEALRQVVWSAAVQYGPGWIGDLFTEAAALAGREVAEVDDATLIANVYAVRASDGWTAGSPGLRPSLRARFAAECREALGMLDSDQA